MERNIPKIKISAPSVSTVAQGDSVSFRVIATNTDVFELKSAHIIIVGEEVNAVVKVSGTGNFRQITLSKVYAPEGKPIGISIQEGVAKNKLGVSEQSDITSKFRVKGKCFARPSIHISAPSCDTIKEGDHISFMVKYEHVVGINLKPVHIRPKNFICSVKIVSKGDRTKEIKLENIKGDTGKKYFRITPGTSWDVSGEKDLGISRSEYFKIQ